jgi:hypothetical protein
MSIINQHIVGHRGARHGRIPASSLDLVVTSAPCWTAIEYDTRARAARVAALTTGIAVPQAFTR